MFHSSLLCFKTTTHTHVCSPLSDPFLISPKGIASMTVPVYIAEVSPPHLRGQLVTINSLFITGGQFIASVVDGGFSYLSRDGWRCGHFSGTVTLTSLNNTAVHSCIQYFSLTSPYRRYMLGLSVVPAVLQFIGFIFLPESPRWLLQKGRTQDARRVLSQIREEQSIDEEFDTIRTSIEAEETEASGGERCRRGRRMRVYVYILIFNSDLWSLRFRRPDCLAHPQLRPHSKGSHCRLWPPDVSAAVWDKHCHVGDALRSNNLHNEL